MGTNKGRIRNTKTKKLKFQKTHSGGYKVIEIQVNGKMNHLYVHRLVAEAFISNPLKYPYVNHKDENKQNNDVNSEYHWERG